MNNVLVRLVPLAVLLGVAGCAAESDAPPPPPAAEETAPPSATTQIHMVYTGVSERADLSGLDYEVTVELGEPVSDGAGCELAAPAGTVTVPVTMRLVNTHDPDSIDTVEAAADTDGESVRWVKPRYMVAEPVGSDGPLRWAPKRAGASCTDQPDLDSFVSSRWEYRAQTTLTGYLTGVPESDRDGVGVRLEFARELWDVHQGAPEPLTVTY